MSWGPQRRVGICVGSAKKRPLLGILGREGRQETAAARDSGYGAFRDGHSLRFRVLRRERPETAAARDSG